MWKATIWCSNWRTAGSSTWSFLIAIDSPSTASEVSVHELVPGTKLTQTITTTTTPRYVNSVRTIEGKVWHANAPKSLILTLPDNKSQVFNVPNDAKFTIDGQGKDGF